MAQDWYCLIAETEYGPLTPAELRSMAKSGKLAPEDLVRKTQAGKWASASQIKGLLASEAPAVPAPKDTSSVTNPGHDIPPAQPQWPSGQWGATCAMTLLVLVAAAVGLGYVMIVELPAQREKLRLEREARDAVAKDEAHWKPTIDAAIAFVGKVEESWNGADELPIPTKESMLFRGKAVVWLHGGGNSKKIPLGPDLDATPDDRQLTLFLVTGSGGAAGVYDKSKRRAGYVSTHVTVVYWPQKQIAGRYEVHHSSAPPELEYDPRKKYDQGGVVTGSTPSASDNALKSWIIGLPRSP